MVYVGSLIFLAGVGRLLALVIGHGVNVSPWSMAPALFVMGFGMRIWFSSFVDVARATSG